MANMQAVRNRLIFVIFFHLSKKEFCQPPFMQQLAFIGILDGSLNIGGIIVENSVFVCFY